MNSQQFCLSDNFTLLLWDYYSSCLRLLLGAKLTIRITGRGAMVGIKLERGGGWKNFEKLIMWSMYNDKKDFVA